MNSYKKFKYKFIQQIFVIKLLPKYKISHLEQRKEKVILIQNLMYKTSETELMNTLYSPVG